MTVEIINAIPEPVESRISLIVLTDTEGDTIEVAPRLVSQQARFISRVADTDLYHWVTAFDLRIFGEALIRLADQISCD